MRSFAVGAAALVTSVVAVSCGGGAGSDPGRSYTLGLRIDDGSERYRYVATGDVDIRVGDEVEFVLDNTGALPHDLQIVDPDGAVMATTEVIAPGGRTTATVRFGEAGYHRLNCLVGDHLTAHEMQTIVEVTDSAG